jgi:hypothetical protein
VPEYGHDFILWSFLSIENWGFYWACWALMELEKAAVEGGM